jgi:hypothetical protein
VAGAHVDCGWSRLALRLGRLAGSIQNRVVYL